MKNNIETKEEAQERMSLTCKNCSEQNCKNCLSRENFIENGFAGEFEK